jgi:hypothetical protein
VHGVSGGIEFDHHAPTRSTIFRTGRLLAPSVPVIVAHALQNVQPRPVPPPERVRLVQHPVLAAAVALDAQEPRREGGERLG